MLEFLWWLAVWLVQMSGAWILAAVGLLMPLLRTDFSGFALARSAATAVVVLVLAYQCGFAPDGPLGVVDAIVAKYLVMGAIAAAALVVLSIVYVSVGRPGARRARFRRLFSVRTDDSRIPGPITVMLLLIATTAYLGWVLNGAGGYGNEFVRFISFVIVFLPAVAFLLLVPFSVAGTVFNAANTHPALPALASPFIVGAAIVTDRFVGGVIATPDNLKEPLALTGLATVTTLSAIELVRLHRTGHGLAHDAEEESGRTTEGNRSD